MRIAEYYYRVLKKSIPYYAKYPLWLIIWKPIRKFINVVIIPNVPFANIRILLYRYIVGYKIGKNVFIGMKCYLDDLEPQSTVLENDVVISYGCYFSLHGINQKHSFILLKKGAYLGMRATVIAGNEGITIGENTLVGAASLVTKSLPSNVKAVGVPAKIITQ
jgi:acetyltransferase-like isoleucine patch superfamily enzyme